MDRNDLISRSALEEKAYTTVILEPDESGIDYVAGQRFVVDLEDIENAPTVDLWQLRQEATENALKKAEVHWEDVKQALNGWLNNTTSPNTALNEIYRAYMERGSEPENSHIEYTRVNGVPGLYKQEIVTEPDKQITIEEYMQSLKGEN